MLGLVPSIHDLGRFVKDVDGRAKPDHDAEVAEHLPCHPGQAVGASRDPALEWHARKAGSRVFAALHPA